MIKPFFRSRADTRYAHAMLMAFIADLRYFDWLLPRNPTSNAKYRVGRFDATEGIFLETEEATGKQTIVLRRYGRDQAIATVEER